jgi:peptide/nickel transport system substrate-binding protein
MCRGLRAGIGALACATALAIAGCGDEAGRDGGTVTMVQSSQPDSLDPALSYTLNGWQPMWLVYTPLLTYRRAEGAAGTELIPGLAEELPEISRDGRRYALRLREGLRFSDGRPVRASDFEHTVKRILNLESGGSYYFTPIVGAEEYMTAADADADIAGIDTDDRSRRIEIRLERPNSTFANALATNFAGIVPGDTPFRSQTKTPPPGVGPFALADVRPNRGFVLERNDDFDIAGIPAAKLDRIEVDIAKNAELVTRRVLEGELDSMLDAPAPQLLKEIRASHADRYREHPTLQTAYFFLDQSQPPFDDRRVRAAASLAARGAGFERLYGGLLAPGCGILPPSMPGSRAGDDPCPWGAPGQAPDIASARALVKAAGASGAAVDVWTPDAPPAADVATAFAGALDKIGLEAGVKQLDFAVYQQTVGKASTGAQAGMVTYGADFPHPQVFLSQFSADFISDEYNVNLGNVRDPVLTDGVARLTEQSDLARATPRWRELDQRVTDRADAVIVGYPLGTTFMSERMDIDDCALFHPVYGNDYSSWCLSE